MVWGGDSNKKFYQLSTIISDRHTGVREPNQLNQGPKDRPWKVYVTRNKGKESEGKMEKRVERELVITCQLSERNIRESSIGGREQARN